MSWPECKHFMTNSNRNMAFSQSSVPTTHMLTLCLKCSASKESLHDHEKFCMLTRSYTAYNRSNSR